MKTCTKCGTELPLSGFYRDKHRRDGKQAWCKACRRSLATAYYKVHQEERRAYSLAYYAANPEEGRASSATYRAAHPGKGAAAQRVYYQKNREKVNARQRKYRRIRRKTDPMFRLAGCLRGRLGKVLRGKTKVGSAVRDMGCTIEYLKSYLEDQFQEGMTWENWGQTGWHLDHIRPLAFFDLTDPIQLKKACHYTNLQPLWAEDNLIKGARTGVYDGLRCY